MPPMRRSAAWIAPSNTGLSAWSGCSRWGRCNGGKCGESMCVCPKSWGYPQIIQVDCLSIEAYGDLGIFHFRIPPYEYESRFKTCDICDHRFWAWALTIWFLKWPDFHTREPSPSPTCFMGFNWMIIPIRLDWGRGYWTSIISWPTIFNHLHYHMFGVYQPCHHPYSVLTNIYIYNDFIY